MERIHILGEEGKVVEWFEVNSERKRNGMCVRMHANGFNRMNCFYKDDVREGVYQRWWSNKQQKILCEYKNGVRKGEYTQWDVNGDVIERRLYAAGVIVKRRPYIRRVVGNMVLNEEFENKVATGRKIVTIYGGANRERISLGEYANGGILDGKFMYWVNGVKISEIKMVGGRKHGIQYYYYAETGKIYKFITYRNGLREGLHEEWDGNGQTILKANYKDDKLHGSVRGWYIFGGLRYHFEYVNGKIKSIEALNDVHGRSGIISALNSVAWQPGFAIDPDTKKNLFVYIKFSIPYSAKKITTVSDKFICRVSSVKVEKIIDLAGKPHKLAKPFFFDDDKKIIYSIGKIITEPEFDPDISNPGGKGLKVHIHQQHCTQWFLNVITFSNAEMD
ncbi:MAG: hypothetical protein Hyperionvirus2_41 [Hyperionvirus sp.]|uniref:MORN repeat-containing protein n=1 Tax=Hyperionvirus sp. TaxID=2487770 RepID=A0A3G5AA00_9VIRU|nr:MAG: hypothetical protein Hyperionvirus2_41 [Hyperionvirus sp.]